MVCMKFFYGLIEVTGSYCQTKLRHSLAMDKETTELISAIHWQDGKLELKKIRIDGFGT